MYPYDVERINSPAHHSSYRPRNAAERIWDAQQLLKGVGRACRYSSRTTMNSKHADGNIHATES
jgi:hypothetical protein